MDFNKIEELILYLEDDPEKISELSDSTLDELITYLIEKISEKEKILNDIK